jgi:8-oxo-dGTP pyrophosphatase MutT (NUDIX family)
MPVVEVPYIEKVVAYVVRDDCIAAFIHDDDADPVRESGLQVPAGTCEPGEEPAEAVLREAREESGLTGLRVVRYLGEAVYDMRPYANAVHHRRFFHLAAPGPVPDEWRHVERDGGPGQPRPFRFCWLPIRQGHVLAAGHGALLGALAEG